METIKGLPDFFNDNFMCYDDFTPDSKLTALRKGLLAYYETYNIWENGFYEYFQKTPSKIILNKARGHSYLIKYFSSITFIHLSFEQFIFSILEKKSPILAKLNFEKQFDIVKILIGIKNINVSGKKYVDYSIALSRIRELIENHNNLTPEWQLDTKYHFLLGHLDTLKHLSLLRNDIIHSGQKALNKYPYEFFFVNKLLPLIREYLNIEGTSEYLERNLYCKKNVIDEITRFPLPEKFNEIASYDELRKKLKRINHLKELGRASYNNPILMMENVLSEDHKRNLEETVNKRKRDEAGLYVHFRQKTLGHYEVHTCPCCGTNSLTTYDFWTLIENNKTRVETAECIICSYRVNINIGDPKEFGIMETELFKFLD